MTERKTTPLGSLEEDIAWAIYCELIPEDTHPHNLYKFPDVEPHTKFREDLGLSYEKISEVLKAVEKEFDIVINIDETINNVKDVVSMIEDK